MEVILPCGSYFGSDPTWKLFLGKIPRESYFGKYYYWKGSYFGRDPAWKFFWGKDQVDAEVIGS